MSKLSRPRYGSLQFYPRKRASRFLPSVNWAVVKGEGLLGFIGYKVGMATAIVKDNTQKSMTLGKKIAIPVTILEVPPMKIYSVRFYKNGQVIKEAVVSNDKELKRKVKIPKQIKTEAIDNIKDFDDLRVIVYSMTKQTSIKKVPDMSEIGIGGKDKIGFVKGLIGKELIVTDLLKGNLLDARGLTKGKGLEGPVPRFGISLKAHKSEKGRRRPGSLGPWHPAHVTFRVPQAGQLGMFTRVHYNLKVIGSGKISEKDINKKEGFRHYGNIKTGYIILQGSVQGVQKREILLTNAMRPTKKQLKKNYEFLELVK